jgi:riboflavin synthase
MFTGLVEGLGNVVTRTAEGAGMWITIAPPPYMFEGTFPGDSVALNGCCLTVVNIGAKQWEFQAGPETLARTNLGELVPGKQVNLERALPANARLGGHFVQGHIDGCGAVEQILPTGDWVSMWFSAPSNLTRQMVSKGSIAVDGVSLTLVDVESSRFSVALIPHTLKMTSLGSRQVGDRVNLETDILAKYVEKLLATRT